MTREEAIATLQEKYDYCKSFYDLAAYPEISYPGTAKYMQALQVALSALRPVSRERVEKVWRGEWLHPHWHNSESCADCSRCNADVGHREFRGVQTEYNFCPVCGAAQNDKAVDMVMERLEALYEKT